MTAHLKLTIHVTEPWDFERSAGRETLTGWTTDHLDPEAPEDEWEIHLDEGFDFNDHHYGRLLINPRYVGERLTKVINALVGFPIRIAHRDGDGGWHYAFAGTLTLRHESEEEKN